MTTVRIGEKDYPWPDGCEYFERRGDQFIFWYQKGVRGFICSNPNGDMCPMGAAVAARHFRNKILPTKFNNVLGVMVIDAERELERRAMFDAAKAWETLCN